MGLTVLRSARSYCRRGAPEGRPGMSDVSPLSGISGLSFDSTLLSPLLFFCLILILVMSYLFCLQVHSSKLFPENSSIFFVKRQAKAPVQWLGDVSWQVVCAAYCHMALVFGVMHLYNIKKKIIASVDEMFHDTSVSQPCVFFFFFLTGGNTEGTDSLRVLCLMFVYFFVLCGFVSGLIL